MSKIIPMDDNVIVEIIPQTAKIGSIIIPDVALDKSSLAQVVIPNVRSYHRNGELRDVTLVKGMKVRIPKGKVGTTVPESPEGKEWLAIPEDCIYYIVED